MLGEKIGEESGKVTLRRVLANPGGVPKVETTFEASGSILNVNHMTIGSYTSVLRPDGSLLGEGTGPLRCVGRLFRVERRCIDRHFLTAFAA